MTAAVQTRRVSFGVQGQPLYDVNQLMRVNPHKYGKHVETLAGLIAGELQKQGIRTGTRSWQALRFVQVVLIVRHPANADTDNKYGYAKALLDALKYPHQKNNPCGLGVIVDDSDGEHGAPGYIKALIVKQIHGDWAFEVEITEVTP